jgi:hypothetical protein
MLALMAFKPSMMKYQNPQLFDIHTSGVVSQYWKAGFEAFLDKQTDLFIESVLRYSKAILIFDKENLDGNVILVPLEETEYPKIISDTVTFRKYITWKPPSNMISAIVPPGYRIRFEFNIDGIPDKVDVKIIEDGTTKAFTISQPIKSVFVEKL